MTALKDRPQRSVFATLGPTMLKPGKNLFDDYPTLKPNSSDSRRTELQDLEAEIGRGCRQINLNAAAVNEALRKIKEKKLYLLYFETFEEYCTERLGKSVRAVYEQLKTLEIFDQLALPAPDNVRPAQKAPLEIKDLQPLAKLSGPATVIATAAKKILKDNPKATAKEIASTIKSQKLGKAMPPTPVDTEPEEENLLDEIITRIRRAKSNQHFLKALKEWLDDSGM